MSSTATPATQSDDPCHEVPRLPHKVKVDVTKCHACHAKRRGVPAPPGNQARHQSQPSAISATPAAQSNDPCHQLPRLPRKVTIHVMKCHAWPHKVKVDVTKCHACHAKRRGVPAPPGKQARHQSQPSAISATPATQSDDPCHEVPRLPHKVKVDVTKCHACHAKRRGVPAPPGNQARHQSQPSAISATPATQSDDPCHQVPRLPRKVTIHVIKCHACHAKRRGVPAPLGNQARHQSQPSAISMSSSCK